MPARTIFEHRGSLPNKYGHRSRIAQKRASSPIRGRVPNSLRRVGCTICNPEVNQRITRNRVAHEAVLHGLLQYASYGQDELTVALHDAEIEIEQDAEWLRDQGAWKEDRARELLSAPPIRSEAKWIECLSQLRLSMNRSRNIT